MMAQLLRAAAIAEQKVLSQDDPIYRLVQGTVQQVWNWRSCPADPYPVRKAIQPRCNPARRSTELLRLLVNKRRNRHAGA
jgi:hypothetical protein